MGKEFEHIDEKIQHWIERQKMFFVSTAPRSDEGVINCSPKGLDSLRVLGPRQMAYVDTGGSGIETMAHLKENGRIVIMLCAFEGPPKIYRFYGRGHVVEPHQAQFEALVDAFPTMPTIRNFVVVDVTCIRDSCGFGVPEYTFKGERDALHKWCADKTEDELRAYRERKNGESLDGLPGLARHKV